MGRRGRFFGQPKNTFSSSLRGTRERGGSSCAAQPHLLLLHGLPRLVQRAEGVDVLVEGLLGAGLLGRPALGLPPGPWQASGERVGQAGPPRRADANAAPLPHGRGRRRGLHSHDLGLHVPPPAPPLNRVAQPQDERASSFWLALWLAALVFCGRGVAPRHPYPSITADHRIWVENRKSYGNLARNQITGHLKLDCLSLARAGGADRDGPAEEN